MVDVRAALQTEKKVFELLKDHPKLKKYKLELHYQDNKNVDIKSTLEKYQGIAIEVENTEQRWSIEDPYPPSWRKGFSVPKRKDKYYWSNPLSIYVKVNSEVSRAVIAPMSFICASEVVNISNNFSSGFRKPDEVNDFFLIKDPNHPAISYCIIEKLPEVVAGQLDILMRLKNLNEAHTDKRPIFTQEKKKNA